MIKGRNQEVKALLLLPAGDMCTVIDESPKRTRNSVNVSKFKLVQWPQHSLVNYVVSRWKIDQVQVPHWNLWFHIDQTDKHWIQTHRWIHVIDIPSNLTIWSSLLHILNQHYYEIWPDHKSIVRLRNDSFDWSIGMYSPGPIIYSAFPARNLNL
jgi:hypothetical protein